MNSHTAQASNIALEWLIDQYSSMDFDERRIYSVQGIQDYYYYSVEDYPAEYDQDYYSIWYVDQRSPCIDWNYVVNELQDKMDDIYLEKLFS